MGPGLFWIENRKLENQEFFLDDYRLDRGGGWVGHVNSIQIYFGCLDLF